LFKGLEFIDCTSAVSAGIIPKIGSKIEHDLLNRLEIDPTLSTYLIDNDEKYTINDNNIIWYHNAPQYWIRAMNFIPEFHSKNDKISSHVKKIYVKDHKNRNSIIAILNSSLFYWFFIIRSDCRDLNSREINNFRINLEKIDSSSCNLLNQYTTELMEDLKLHSEKKVIVNKNTGTVAYQEFYPKYSKPIIDKIDEILSNYYGLTEEQKKFIINFDLRFRMRENSKIDKLKND
jgi:hypothetical protein